MTDIWLTSKEFTSRRRPYIHELHQFYGPVVRSGPNEVSFTSLDALKKNYTSAGSGYDKTELYTLFTQFGVRWVDFLRPLYAVRSKCGCRTMFSSLEKANVRGLLLLGEPLLTHLKHSQKKRYIAGQYTNTNIMRPQVMGGIQGRSDAFVSKCTGSQGGSMDVYVTKPKLNRGSSLLEPDPFALLRS